MAMAAAKLRTALEVVRPPVVRRVVLLLRVLGMVRVGEVVLVRLSGWCLVVVFVSPAVCIYTRLEV